MEKIEPAVDRLTKRGLIRQKGFTRTTSWARVVTSKAYTCGTKDCSVKSLRMRGVPSAGRRKQAHRSHSLDYVALDPTELEEFLAVEGWPAFETAKERGLP